MKFNEFLDKSDDRYGVPLANSDDIENVVNEIKNIPNNIKSDKPFNVIAKNIDIDKLSNAIGNIKLAKGEKGDKGDKGDTGEKGDNGSNGKDGRDGKDGYNGKDAKDPNDYTDNIKEVVTAVKGLKLNPKITVSPADVRVDTDFSPLNAKLDEVKSAVENINITIPDTDNSSVIRAVSGVKKSIDSLSFPVPNYILPFKNQSGAAVQALVDDDGKLNVDIDMATEGIATEAKQDSQITQLANILIELTQKTEATQNQQVELINAIRLVLQSIANPAYVDKSANQMRSQVTGSLTAVTTVTTVTNLTNIGSFPADHLQRMDNRIAWATNVRQIIV